MLVNDSPGQKGQVQSKSMFFIDSTSFVANTGRRPENQGQGMSVGLHLSVPPTRQNLTRDLLVVVFTNPAWIPRWTLGNPEREAISRNLSYLPLGRIWLKTLFYCGIKRVSAHLLLVRCTQSPEGQVQVGHWLSLFVGVIFIRVSHQALGTYTRWPCWS